MAWESPGRDVDRDRDAVGEHVVDGRAGPGLLDQAAQDLVRGVAGEPEGNPDLLVAVAHLVGEAQDAEQVDVTLHSGGNGLQRYAAGRRDVGDAGGQAGGDRVQEELHRRRPLAGAHEYGRVVGVVGEVRGAAGVLRARAEEAADGAAVVG